MKRILALLLLGLMIFSLAACGKKEEAPAPAESDTQIEEPVDSSDEGDTTTDPAATPDADAEKPAALVSALETTFASGYAGTSEAGQQVFVAFTQDSTKAFFCATENNQSVMLFGALELGEDGSGKIIDDVDGNTVEMTIGQDEAGQYVMTMSDGTQFPVNVLTAEQVTETINNLGAL